MLRGFPVAGMLVVRLWRFPCLVWLALAMIHRPALAQAEPLRPPVPPSTAEALSPDLALYREVIAAVREGHDYYAAAHECLLAHGFPVTSPLNWRLPTYAWLFAWWDNDALAQGVLFGLSLAAIALSGLAGCRWFGPRGTTGWVVALSCGVVAWSITGAAFYAQETWAGVLLLLSLAAHMLEGRWRVLALAAGLGALAFRELALPYCLLACCLSGRQRRWWEASGWLLGVFCFLGWYGWHVARVRLELGMIEQPASTQLQQWLSWGGANFLLQSARMNSLLYPLPTELLAVYVAVAIGGWPCGLLLMRCTRPSLRVGTREAHQRTPGDQGAAAAGRPPAMELPMVASACYSALFCCFGRPENYYWGLVSAPCLLWGFGSGVHTLCQAAASAAGMPRLRLEGNQGKNGYQHDQGRTHGRM